jgi:hypothetical protein
VGDPLLEAGLRGELLRRVDGVPIAGDAREQEDVFLGEDLREFCGVSHAVHPALLEAMWNDTPTNFVLQSRCQEKSCGPSPDL